MAKHIDWFLSLDDAVIVICDKMQLDVDRELVTAELEQKCYISNNQYDIGYHKALVDMQYKIKELSEAE